MTTISMTVNGEQVQSDDDPDMPLLWFLRDRLHKTGTKFGCGIGECGACTVHVDGVPMRSCSVPIAAVDGQQVTTIEGLAPAGSPTAVQLAWIKEQVPQCGYCQSGMIMAVTALLADTRNPTDDDIDAAITNICRCGTYPRIRKAIKQAALMGATAYAASGEKTNG